MREAIGGTWLFTIVIFFVLLFTAYLALSINYSKAYGVKSEMVDIIERERGLYSFNGNGPVDEIYEYLDRVSYHSKGKCPDGNDDHSNWYGYDDAGEAHIAKDSNESFLFCVKRISALSDEEIKKGEVPYTAYFRIKVFFQLDLPIFGTMFNLNISGDTTSMANPKSQLGVR